MNRVFLSFFLLLALPCFRSIAQQSPSKLDSYAQFHQLASQPLNPNLGELESVKVVYELATDKLWFLNSKRYKYHYSFCTEFLGLPVDVEAFNTNNYGTSARRRFLLCNINYRASDQLWFMDFSVFDQMPEAQVVLLATKIRERAFFGNKLKVLLNTERLLGLQSKLEPSVSVLLPVDLYTGKVYQQISFGNCIGRVRIEPNLDSLSSPLRPTDILVTRGTPKTIPNVRGLIIDEFQTPLSHLVILGKNRDIPIAVNKNIFSDSAFLRLNGKWVTLKVDNRKMTYRLSKPGGGTTKTRTAMALVADTMVSGLIPVKDFQKVGKHAIGNKAWNFGILEQLKVEGNYKTPESAFAIPFKYYIRHAQKSNIKPLLDQISRLKLGSEDSLELLLKQVRKVIKMTPVDPSLAATIRAELAKSSFTTFRFRSSTNAEDAAGFSGAGLYLSKTVDLNDTSKTIEKAIVDVWAGLWQDEAYAERRVFGISNKNLAMGILIHRSFPEEEANGVVITNNLYRQGYIGITVNVQVGDVSVVQPPKGTTCDQLVILKEATASGFERSVEYISTSSLNGGKPVLSDAEILMLEHAVETVKQYYWKYLVKRIDFGTYGEFGLDLEFKFQGEKRELYLKQVRIFNG